MTIAFIAYDNCLASSIALPIEMWQAANNIRRTEKIRSEDNEDLSVCIAGRRKLIHCAGNIALQSDCKPQAIQRPRLIILPAIWRSPLSVLRKEKELIGLLAKWHDQGAMLCAVGSSTMLLAEAGLLDNKAATTHWSQIENFRRRYNKVQLKPDFLITQSDRIYCVSSVNSVADLLIYFIEDIFGNNIAKRVEANFSPEVRKPYSSSLFRQGDNADHQTRHSDEDIIRLQHWLKENYRQGVSAQDMANMLDISVRTLNRRFKASLEISPMQYLNNIKIDHAKELLKQTNLSITEVAQTCGFKGTSYFSQTFRKHTSMAPARYRNAVKGKLFSLE